MNRYLKDRLMQKFGKDERSMRDNMDHRMGQDYRRGRDRDFEPQYDYRGYDSRMTDSRRGYDSNYGNDSRDYANYDRRLEYGKPVEFYTYGIGGMRNHPDYHSSKGYEEEELEHRYHKDLKRWIEKLQSKDKFEMSEDQIIQQAKSLGIRFKEFSETEFYAIYLAMVSDYHKTLGNDVMIYIKLARDFLEDDDMGVTPSEKVCIYYYYIVKGE